MRTCSSCWTRAPPCPSCLWPTVPPLARSSSAQSSSRRWTYLGASTLARCPSKCPVSNGGGVTCGGGEGEGGGGGVSRLFSDSTFVLFCFHLTATCVDMFVTCSSICSLVSQVFGRLVTHIYSSLFFGFFALTLELSFQGGPRVEMLKLAITSPTPLRLSALVYGRTPPLSPCRIC